MRPSLYLLILTTTTVSASWFGSDSDSKDTSSWTADQYASAQKSFANIRETTFDKWDESRLREFLLDQGIVAPKGPREQLILLAKDRYYQYTNAASSFSAQASTAVYGDSAYQATQSISSLISQATTAAAQATKDTMRALDDSKDYVYSTWDDNRLRSYLESKGVKVQEKAQKSRADLLGMMRDSYAKVTNPVWEAWSDSYIHEWLVSYNILSPTPPNPYSREFLLGKMKQYYYDVNDTVYSTWSDSTLKNWLVENGIIKSDAQLKRDKMLRLIQDNYYSTTSTFWSAWSDNQIRDYLIDHGYMRSDAKVKRDDMVKLANEKYTDASSRTAAYLAWPDARLRAFLRENGLSEDKVPTARPGLLQETRIRWVQTHNRADALWAKIRDIVNNVEEGVEDRLWSLWSLLRGGYEEGKDKGEEGYAYGKANYESGKRQAGEKYAQGKEEGGRVYSEAEKKYEQGKARAYEEAGKRYDQAGAGAQDARENVGEKVKTAGGKIKGEL
ncbi:hypothetical protein BDZ94DRAFT_1265910 [Collybia nuda]|uniref:Uncharacterized protein n=1 Tax=Collybia nuda TaxID=64659 RepID=A0A9P5Y3B8_9AGAR|nr:hypothetical protein BDZ94DRAFT_1265910 [Collybia nuda]